MIVIRGKTSTIGIGAKYHELMSKPICQMDKEGNVISTFPSIYAAEMATGIRHIYECVNKKRKSAGGYIWCVLGE